MSIGVRYRQDTAANWAAVNPILGDGEPGRETDTGKKKVGNGVDAWATLEYEQGELFTQVGAGTVERLLSDKAGEIASVTDWFSDEERADAALAVPLMNHTAAIQAAVTAQQGKALLFPSLTYVNTQSPNGIDNVHCMGTPRAKFIGVQIPLFSGVFTGNGECALVGGVIRYYAAGPNGAGWYFIKDQVGTHDPTLLGPITVSGSGSVVLEMNVSDFGLDRDLWTPSGFVCGPDNAFALSGLIFGASVGSDVIQIYGAYGGARTAYIRYDGAQWVGTNAPYTYSWVAGASAKLVVTRVAGNMRESYASGSVYPIIVPRVSASDPFLHVALDSASAASFEVRFYDAAGANITVQSDKMKFYVTDPMMKPQAFPFNVAPATVSANIWMIGLFRRRAETY